MLRKAWDALLFYFRLLAATVSDFSGLRDGIYFWLPVATLLAAWALGKKWQTWRVLISHFSAWLLPLAILLFVLRLLWLNYRRHEALQRKGRTREQNQEIASWLWRQRAYAYEVILHMPHFDHDTFTEKDAADVQASETAWRDETVQKMLNLGASRGDAELIRVLGRYWTTANKNDPLRRPIYDRIMGRAGVVEQVAQKYQELADSAVEQA